MLSYYRRVPSVFRITGVLLIVAAIAGQVWQRQPADRFTRALLAQVAGPARRQRFAALTFASPTVPMRLIAPCSDSSPTATRRFPNRAVETRRRA